jgi:hypothetical protein
MLHQETVGSELLGLLKFLMQREEFQPFRLVGGTSLALQYGHRLSVDIDLFGNAEIDRDYFISILQNYTDNIQIIAAQKKVFICIVNNVKLDFVNYQFPWLEDFLEVDSIRLAKSKDIAAMKLNAIAGRGKKKDFIDLDLLLKSISLKEMIEFYKKKYNQTSEFMVLKSLLYFEDANLDVDPQMFVQYNWENIKQNINRIVRSYSLE